MAFEHKPNSGSLFKNEEKTGDTHADYAGDGIINGVPMWINMWKNTGKNGVYLSLKFREKILKEQKHEPSKTVQRDIDDEIPF